jgi:hypothetical protein
MGVETLGAAQRRTPTLPLPLPRGGNELDHVAYNHTDRRKGQTDVSPPAKPEVYLD